jgi:tRNA A-37 threonylcarbamoyl transferase component Bud32
MDQPVAPPWLEHLSEEFQERYAFRRLLGAGVTSCVYLARQASLDRDVVVKLLRTEYEAESDVAERFRREAAVLAGLHHDRVVTLLDFGTDGDVLYMVYPDVGGRSLEVWSQARVPVDPREAIPILADILEGLAVIHGEDIVHRDLKPANTLVNDQGRVVLIDFGLAKDRAGHRTLTATGHIVGTPNYMAPGQVLGEPTSPGDDLYAVGVMAYELLVGRNPFTAGDLTRTLQNHLTLRPDSPARVRPEVPVDLAEWVMDLLEKSEADRIPSADEARERLIGLEGVRTLPGVWIPQRGDDGPSRTQLMRRWQAERAAAPVPRSGRGLGVAIGIFLVATLVGVMWPERDVGPGPVVASPAATEAGAAKGPELPAGLVEAVEEELVGLFERRVDGKGQVTQDADAPRSISNDPAKWGEVFPRLHALGRFHDWLAAGGRPEELGQVDLDGMERVDGVFRDLGFLPPFLPYRKVRPSAGPVAHRTPRLVGGARLPDELLAQAWPGWAGAFRLAVAEAESRRVERERTLVQAIAAAEWERLPVRFEPYLGVEALVRPAARRNHRQLSRMFAYYDTTMAARQDYVRWMDPDQAHVRALLWSAARAVREQPELADQLALVSIDWLDQFRALLRGPLAHGPPRFALGFLPDGPRGAHLEASFLSISDLGGDFPSLRRQEAAAWERALVPTGSGVWANRRLVEAMRRGADAHHKGEDVAGWERHCRRSLALLPRLDDELRQQAVGSLLWAVQAWSLEIRGELRAELAAALDRIGDELVAGAPSYAATLRDLRAALAP